MLKINGNKHAFLKIKAKARNHATLPPPLPLLVPPSQSQLFYNSSRCSQGSYNAWRVWNTQFWKISFHSRRLRSSSKPQKEPHVIIWLWVIQTEREVQSQMRGEFLRNALTWLVCDSERAWPVFLLRYYSLLEKPSYLFKKSDVYIVCFILMHVFLSLSHCIAYEK